MNKLRIISISYNLLGSANDVNFLCSLTNATDLYVLDMSLNSFGGVLPDCISNLSTNLALFLSQANDISGTIPAGIGNLINLRLLALDINSLSGSIPSEIGRLPLLQEFDLSNNSLGGAIPSSSSLGDLKMLYKLYLGHNNLQGSIPSSLANCDNLLLLDLSNNNLTGSIPLQILGLSSLSIGLDLSSNHLTGVLPYQVGSLQNLGFLSVSHNRLSGLLPASLGGCVMLEQLDVSDNMFHGPIPSSWSSLRGLVALDISRNNLSGKIPDSFVNFKSLEYLNLSYNDFEGVVPSEGAFKNASATSVEGNNKLCGGILEFHLPRCNFKRSTSRSFKLIIGIASASLGIILVCSFLLILWFRRKKKSQPTSSLGENSLLRLSYKSILKATNDFSPANLVGAGSFGSVYKGILEEEATVIAVKVLNLFNRGAARSFMAECETLRNIRHRNLVKVLTACSGTDYKGNDFKALVYEFMVNGSLEAWLHPSTDLNEADMPTKSLNLCQRLNVAVDVACAMDYLHHHCETPIVHCDLKPSNILLDDGMVGHVGDFGLAKFIHADMQNYSTSQSSSRALGTIGYAPPEYGLGSEVSTYGDVYSYGIVLLEIFSGKRPTDEVFKDGMSLHNFVKEALPNRAIEITDPVLVQETIANFNSRVSRERENIVVESLNSIFEIGVSCSDESPTKRMKMSDVAAELCLIINKLFPPQLHEQRS